MLRNNKFSHDSDAERWERLDLLATNIDTYAVELAVAGEKLQWAKGACAAWETARTGAGVELGEKEEAFQEYHQKLDELSKYYTSAKELLLAVIYEYEKPDEIIEEYHIDGESPRDLKRLVAHVDWWNETHERLKAAGDPRIIADSIVAQLVTFRNETKALWEFAIKQKREKLDAFEAKDLLFAQDGKKLIWLLSVCKLVWGYDDHRLLELGLVPKSQIWTPAPFPPPDNFAHDGTKFTWDMVEDAAAYEVDYRLTGASGDWTTLYEGADNYTTEKPPDPGEYDFRVRAIADGKLGAWSGVLPVNFPNGGILPAPFGLVYDQFRNQFTWMFVPGADNYELEISKDGIGWEQIYAGSGNHAYYELLFGTWKVRARAMKGSEVSEWGVGIPVEIVFMVPDNFKYDPMTKMFTWDPVPGATIYELVQQGVPDFIYMGSDTSFMYEFQGTQSFRIRAGNDEFGRWGQWSEWVELTA